MILVLNPWEPLFHVQKIQFKVRRHALHASHVLKYQENKCLVITVIHEQKHLAFLLFIRAFFY